MKILLVCAGGMSTSLVMIKIRAAFWEDEAVWSVNADSVENLEQIIDDYDVVLLGPQIGYKKNQLLEMAKEKNKPLDVINSMDYGMGNGINILKQIKKMINK